MRRVTHDRLIEVADLYRERTVGAVYGAKIANMAVTTYPNFGSFRQRRAVRRFQPFVETRGAPSHVSMGGSGHLAVPLGDQPPHSIFGINRSSRAQGRRTVTVRASRLQSSYHRLGIVRGKSISQSPFGVNQCRGREKDASPARIRMRYRATIKTKHAPSDGPGSNILVRAWEKGDLAPYIE
jgi:hypothetical protein